MIESKDIFADLHTHSQFSRHAYSTIKENLDVAARRKMRFMAVTDHFFGYNEDIMAKNENARIKYMEERITHPTVKLIGGAELNLSQETPEAVLEARWRPIGLHDWFLDRNSASLDLIYELISQSIKENKCTAIAHIEREIHKLNYGKYGTEVIPEVQEFLLKVLQLAHDSDIPMELNESSLKTNEGGGTDRIRFWLTEAKKMDSVIYLGTDAHYCEEVGSFTNSVKMLNDIGFPKTNIVNCNEELFKKYLKL